ncbi:hypothetical protein [Pantoea sp. BAV 3049]|uniref:hypothetical protein n=1 Tax=Pantoea sp. BAV 3049 TaxID=2654188 RepID=UPI00131D36D2|nr:hypothetical protein [Pantoea sp. BAV 3049]
MADFKNVVVTEEWQEVYSGDDDATLICVAGQGEIWRSAGAPAADTLGIPLNTGQSLRGSGRLLGRAAFGTRRAVFVVG